MIYPQALARYLQPFNILQRASRHVQVENGISRQVLRDHPGRNPAGIFSSRSVIHHPEMVFGAFQRYSQAGQAPDHGFHGCSHRA